MTKVFRFRFVRRNSPECGMLIDFVEQGRAPGIIHRLNAGGDYTVCLPDNLDDPIVPEALEALRSHFYAAEDAHVELDDLRKATYRRPVLLTRVLGISGTVASSPQM